MASNYSIKIQQHRLQQRLALEQKLLKKQLEKIIAICRNLEYLRLMNSDSAFFGFKKKMEILNLSKCFQLYARKENGKFMDFFKFKSDIDIFISPRYHILQIFICLYLLYIKY